MPRVRVACALLSTVVAAACTTDSQHPYSLSADSSVAPDAAIDAASQNDAAPLDPGTQMAALPLSDEARVDLDKLNAQLSALATLTPEQLLARHPVPIGPALGYDPRSASNLSLIQSSTLALDASELNKLGAQGFVISKRQAFPNMAYGYRTIYGLDLPVYISLDSILSSVHLSYDNILMSVEQGFLTKELSTLLSGARASLQAGAVADARTARDLDLYFSVALSLLQGTRATPVRGADPLLLGTLVSAAERAAGIIPMELFGTQRELDFSQFTPRGHYTRSTDLERYFRASMWLGRTDFRLLETLPNGDITFRRRQLDAVLAMHTVVQGQARTAYDHIDTVIGAFVGEHDYMQLAEVDALLRDLGVSSVAEAASLSDEQIARVIVAKGYGVQRIASQVIFREPGTDTLPLSISFALLGQRYVVDSHVFSQLVYDRVPSRYLPDPLDAAYAAFGNASALPLLKPQLDQYGYAPNLEQMRTLVDAHGADYWDKNLYNLWLSSLRALSPAGEQANPAAAGLPLVAGSEPWQRRLLNTQLASWAELRHDTILYVKQSYTSGIVCEFPDGYVDPYPEAFERLRLFALKGQEIAALLPADSPLGANVGKYFAELASVTSMLRDMARHERTGTPFDAAQMAFLNDAVRIDTIAAGCTTTETVAGWYARLLFNTSPQTMDPTIADVHTDPGGDRPAKVLHVATGLPRLMVVTTNTCEGPRAYAGLASAYHEVVEGLKRLTDEEWAPMAVGAPDVPWLQPILP